MGAGVAFLGGMLRSLKFTVDPEMNFAHLLLLQIKTSTPTVQGSWNGPCLPGNREGSKALPSQPFSGHMLDMQKIPVSLETGSSRMCCSQLGKFAFIKPPR